jgi:predicted dehydrogenase
MEANTKPIAIGVIGTGKNSRGHMQAFAKLEQYRLVAVADVVREAAERAAKEFGAEKVYGDPADLLADPEIEAVLISVPNRFHEPIAVRALEAGKHVAVEKPLAMNLEAARRVVETQRGSGKLLMVTQQRRWEPVYMKVKEQLERGALGRIYHGKMAWSRRKGIPGWGTWFTRKSESGGGPLIDLGVHVLDLTLYMMNNPKPVSVFGATYSEIGPQRKGISSSRPWNPEGYFDVEDLAVAMIRMEDGSTLTLDTSWAAPIEVESKQYIQLLGTEGGVTISGNGGKWVSERFDRTLETDIDLTIEHGDEPARFRMYRHFADCVRNGKTPITNAVTGYTNQSIIEAIYESARTGREVALESLPTL